MMGETTKALSAIVFTMLVIAMAIVNMTMGQTSHGTANEETPSGVLDGVNVTFSIQHQPLPWASIKVYKDGSRMKRNLDYVLSGPNHTQVIFNPCCVPQPGAVLIADYNF